MESAKLAVVIQTAANLAGRSDLNVVVSVFRAAGKTAAKTTSKKLATRLNAAPAQGTSATAFLGELANLMQLTAAKSVYTDLVAVADVSKRFGQQSADDLIALLSKPKTSARKRGLDTDPAKIRRFADELIATGRSKAAFDEVLAKAEKLKKSDLVDVANTYLGYKVSYKSKAEALKAIRSRHQQDALEDSRATGLTEMAR